MSKSIKMIIIGTIIVLISIIAIGLYNKPNNNKKDKMNIVVTTYSVYDFSKQIVGDNAEVTFLLGPGVDAHSYEPSSSDLIKIKNADVFIFIGGDMEKWVDKIFETDIIDKNKTELIRITDSVETVEEKEIDGVEEDEEDKSYEEQHNHGKGAFEEHIWTSPKNAIKMVDYLKERFSKIDNSNGELYAKNAEDYIEKIKELQSKIQEIVDNKKRDRLVFGDKMPIQYFLEEYNLTATAAFNGCSTDTEPSAKTIAYIINRIKEENIPAILYIELSSGKTAKAIAEETGIKAIQIQTLHNVSKDDFNNGETYVSLMTRNLDALKEALQ